MSIPDSSLIAYVTTYNCGRQPIDVDHFASSLFYGLDTEAEQPPDLIALSLQELAPLGYSFLGGSLLLSFLTRISTAIHDATTRRFAERARYSSIATRNVGMTAFMIFARQDVSERIHWVEFAGIGVGVRGMGNKGAVAVRLGIGGSNNEEETPVTFVAAHLAPNESQCEKRNQDWRDICEGLVFERESRRTRADQPPNPESEPLLQADGDEFDTGPHGLFSPPSHVILAGDLNYRASDKPPSPNESSTWPQPREVSSDAQHFSKHLPRDQLTRERKAGRTLHLLDEAPIDFPPTYKFSDEAQAQARHAVEAMPHVLADGRQQTTMRLRPDWVEKSWLWAEHRVPSWCDRILYLAASKPTIHSYTALPLQPTSDHRPVAALLSIPRGPPQETVKPPFELRRDWRERRAAGRRNEIVVGLASYLGMTWEGELLLGGTVAGIIGSYLVLKALLAAQ